MQDDGLMSVWGTLDARFSGGHIDRHWIETDLPTGSETGPHIHENRDGWWVDGRLRDVSDLTSPSVLAWFVRVCDMGMPDEAALMWEIDRGPRYRYEWRDGTLHKLRGILD
jgi:hypothetical protein